MKKIESIIEYCRNRIRRRMYLNVHPDITVKIRNFEGPDGGGHYKIQPNAWNIIEPSEFWCEEGYFNKVKGRIEEEYTQLHKDTDRNVPFNAYLIEAISLHWQFGDSNFRRFQLGYHGGVEKWGEILCCAGYGSTAHASAMRPYDSYETCRI